MKKGLTMAALVVTVIVLALITSVIFMTNGDDQTLVDETNEVLKNQEKKMITDSIAKEVQSYQLKKEINGDYTFNVIKDVMPILQKYGTYNNDTLKLLTSDGVEIYLYEIMQVPMLEYVTVTYENETLTMTSLLTNNGYILEYSPNSGTVWNTYTTPVTLETSEGVFARITDSEGKVISNTINIQFDI